ncbi:MAG: Wzz/FepE/Etk N-terminal domain-containing protein [Pseudomonadota bacterium]
MDSFHRQPQDYYHILKRRKWWLFIPAVMLFSLAVAAALLLPPTYRSSATILVEEPDVPRDLVSSTITSYADQRLQVITQRVMSTQNLIEVIDEGQLFPDARAKTPIQVLVERMRERIDLEIISAEVVDPRSGQTTVATIAFTLTFDYPQAEKAQQTLNRLVSLYLSENLKTRRKKASETTEFLAKESQKLYDTVVTLESDLATFKEKYAGALPEQHALNLQLFDGTERAMLELRQRERALEEREIYLQAELAQLDPYEALTVNGERILSPVERLNALQVRYVSLQGVYGKRHPDVLKLGREIEALKAETGVAADPAELEKQLDEIDSQLSVARQKYADSHPDIVRLLRQRDGLVDAIAEARAQGPVKVQEREPNNPAYIQIKAQLDAVRSERRALGGQRNDLTEKLEDLQTRLYMTPQVEREYTALMRDHESALLSYREIKAKQTAAELGQALETDQKAEQFSLIEPPELPLEPVRPNRKLILFVGFVFAFGIGCGTVSIREFLDQAVYGSRHLEAVAGAAPLVVLPYIKTRADRRRSWRYAGTAAVVLLALAVGGVFMIDRFYMPLDVILAVAEQRFDAYLDKFVEG